MKVMTAVPYDLTAVCSGKVQHTFLSMLPISNLTRLSVYLP